MILNNMRRHFVAVLIAAATAQFPTLAEATAVSSQTGENSNQNGDSIAWSVSRGIGNGCASTDSPGYQYRYTIHAASDRMYSLSIPLINSSDICSIVAPVDWTHSFDVDAPNVLVFQTQSPLQQSADLAGFGFNSNYDFIKATFALGGSDGPIYIDPPIPNGPASVPAPATLLLTLTGFSALGWMRRTRSGPK